MILVITHKLDFTADFVINKLNERKIDYRRLNCEDILNTDYSVKFGSEQSISLFGEQKFTSIWFRRTMPPNLPLKPEEQKYLLSETDAFIKNLFSILNGKWVSFPSAVYMAENKLFQLQLAKKMGFNIPETLVTSSKDELRTFFKRHKQIVIKPIFQTRINKSDSAEFIFTSSVTEAEMEKLDEHDLTPCLFQKEIKKDVELRITVVNDKTFAAQVKSQEDPETKIDWRKKKLAFSVFSLPIDIHELCINMVKNMGLVFGAIDMILSPDGTYTFLEINPNGQWVWIENETGLKISEALINELI